MGNKAFINDKNLVEIKMENEIKYYKLVNFFISIAALSNSLDASKKDILILVDLSEAISLEGMAKGLITTMFSISIFDRLAFFGANDILNKDMLDVAKNANRADKVKGFKTREETEEWLLSHKIR
ncbi:MAG: hypothetical protein ACMG57_02660 [Candidatus Dojkabacteria bacterium]